jgi:hypothetical protein
MERRDVGFAEDFFTTVQVYNETVVLVTVLTSVLGLVAIYLTSRSSRGASRMVSFILGFLWLWSGIVFHILYYGPIDVELLGMTIPGLWYLSGVLFVAQGLLFIGYGVVRSALAFSVEGLSPCSVAGALFVVYALVLYPVIGVLTGFPYPQYPLFGSFPCPVAIFTWGLLLWTNRRVPLPVAIIPLVWSVMGVLPVLLLGVYADVGLILAGVIGFPLLLLHNRNLGE